MRIGRQRVGIVTLIPNPVVDELMAAQPPTESVTWKDGCLFEIQTAFSRVDRTEQQSDTTTTNEVAWAFFPVDDDTIAIRSNMVLRYNNRDYVMRGDGVHEIGPLPHVFAMCERQTG